MITTLELLGEIEAYVLRHGKWPAAKGWELRGRIEGEEEVRRLLMESVATSSGSKEVATDCGWGG